MYNQCDYKMLIINKKRGKIIPEDTYTSHATHRQKS